MDSMPMTRPLCRTGRWRMFFSTMIEADIAQLVVRATATIQVGSPGVADLGFPEALAPELM